MLLRYLGYCKQYCGEYWGACVLSDHVFLLIRRGCAGTYGSSIFRFLRKLHGVFLSGWTNLHSHQQSRSPFFPKNSEKSLKGPKRERNWLQISGAHCCLRPMQLRTLGAIFPSSAPHTNPQGTSHRSWRGRERKHFPPSPSILSSPNCHFWPSTHSGCN